MRLSVHLRASTVAFVFLSVGLGLGGGAAFTSAQATAANGPVSVFNASGLMPGNTLTSHLDIPSGNQPLTPYLQAHNLQDGCVAGATCPPAGPKLSSTLQFVVTAPDGEKWRGTPADLLTRVLLPGGQLAANSGSTTYGISLIVPTTLVNNSEDRTISLQLEWGGLDGSNQIVTSVLGETFTKGGTGTGGNATSVLGETHNGALPFTGGYIGIELLTGLGLVIAGAGFWLVSWRRRDTRKA